MERQSRATANDQTTCTRWKCGHVITVELLLELRAKWKLAKNHSRESGARIGSRRDRELGKLECDALAEYQAALNEAPPEVRAKYRAPVP